MLICVGKTTAPLFWHCVMERFFELMFGERCQITRKVRDKGVKLTKNHTEPLDGNLARLVAITELLKEIMAVILGCGARQEFAEMRLKILDSLSRIDVGIVIRVVKARVPKGSIYRRDDLLVKLEQGLRKMSCR